MERFSGNSFIIWGSYIHTLIYDVGEKKNYHKVAPKTAVTGIKASKCTLKCCIKSCSIVTDKANVLKRIKIENWTTVCLQTGNVCGLLWSLAHDRQNGRGWDVQCSWHQRLRFPAQLSFFSMRSAARHCRIQNTYIVSHFISVSGQYKKPGNYRESSCPPPHSSFPPLSWCYREQSAYFAVPNRTARSSHDEDRYHQRANYSDSWPQSLDLSLHHMRLYNFSCIGPVSWNNGVCLSSLLCVTFWLLPSLLRHF